VKKPASQVILEFLSTFPIGFDYWLARILAFIAIHTSNRNSGPTERNIQLCPGSLPASQQQYLGRTSIRHTSYSFNLSIDTLDYSRLTVAETDSAQYLNDAIEAMVRSHPDQYQRSYKRFDPTVYDAL